MVNDVFQSIPSVSIAEFALATAHAAQLFCTAVFACWRVIDGTAEPEAGVTFLELIHSAMPSRYRAPARKVQAQQL
jgi:hypothetical protein